ncbi:hypothetical protein HYX04_05890 [Candidatus Woesearchaeota archaeon]|nr:hypothetical protein [Candidatus Woesearchaeota archaeon]
MNIDVRNIASLVREYGKNILLVGGSIVTISLAAYLVEKGIFYLNIAKSVCEQDIATNNLIRERNSRSSAVKENIRFLYAKDGRVYELLPSEVAKEKSEFLPFCTYIASSKKVKQHEEKSRKNGVAIDNPYR